MTTDPDVPSTSLEDRHAWNRLARRGLRLMLGRQAAIRLLGIAGSIVLARVLAPAEFGFFVIVTFIVGLLAIFGDLGFSAYFVQLDEPLNERDLGVSLATQVMTATVVVGTIWAAAPWALHFYPTLPRSAVWMVRALALAAFLDVFRSIYRLQFERRLDFGPIARSDIVEVVAYQLAAVTLALSGFGAWSFVLATLAGDLAGTVTIGMVAPIAARVRFDWGRIRELLPKTIRFVILAPVNALGETATPAIVGTLIGPAAVGFLNFASANARRPILLVEAVAQVSFPHLARVRQSSEALREVLLTYLLGFFWVVLLWSAGVVVAGGPAIELLYSPKWMPAMPALIMFSFALPLDSISWLVGQAFYAVGRPMVVVYIVAIRSVLMLGFAIALVPPIGMNGIPIAYLASNLITAPIQMACFERGLLSLVVRRSVWMAIPTLAAIGAGRGALIGLGHFAWFPPWLRLFAGGVPVVVVYLMATYVAVPGRYREQVHRLMRHPLELVRSQWGGAIEDAR